MRKLFTLIPILFIFILIPLVDAQAYCLWREKQTIPMPSGPPVVTLCTGGEVQSAASSCQGPAATGNSICCCGSGTAPKTVEQIAQETRKQETAVKPPLFTIPDFQVDIPGMKTLSAVDCSTGGKCSIPWIGEYITGLYNYALSIVGILAAIILMAGGVLWLISGGDASKINQAKELIIGSITGLLIMATSYIILLQVNPDLINFKPLLVTYIDRVDLVENGSDSVDNIVSTSCSNNGNMADISGLVKTSNVSDPRLTKAATDGLQKAIDEAKKQNVTLLVTSANRTYEKQKELWDKALKQNKGDEALTRKYVAPPTQCQGTCYSHCAGVAIDLCIYGSTSCKKMNAKSAKATDPDIIKLQDIMKKAGWIRYCGEWWHFQFGSSPKKACSP